MNFHFVKMHGCGNDFLLIDCKDKSHLEFRKSEIVYLCDRNFGIGADGVICIYKSQVADASWRFYNSDGSEADMCGNAARCAIRYLSDRYRLEDNVITIDTRIGIIKGRVVSEPIVEVALSPQRDEKFDYEERILDIEGNVFQVFSLNIGVPHAVLEVKDIRTYPIDRVGRVIQEHPAFKPAKTNVTFIQRVGVKRILSTSFERGVAAQTFACGTGAAAAAIMYSQLYMESPPIEVIVPGGELLVDMSPVSKALLLRGPTMYVMEFEIEAIPQQFEKPVLFGKSPVS